MWGQAGRLHPHQRRLHQRQSDPGRSACLGVHRRHLHRGDVLSDQEMQRQLDNSGCPSGGARVCCANGDCPDRPVRPRLSGQPPRLHPPRRCARDDGYPCTESDTCKNGACTGQTKDCSGKSDACHDGVCQSSTGDCIKKPKQNGAACSDNDSCTTGDSCQNGVCKPGAGITCGHLDDQCNVGACQDNGTCGKKPRANDSPCVADGNLCNELGACRNGSCVAGPAVVARRLTRAIEREPATQQPGIARTQPPPTAALAARTASAAMETASRSACPRTPFATPTTTPVAPTRGTPASKMRACSEAGKPAVVATKARFVRATAIAAEGCAPATSAARRISSAMATTNVALARRVSIKSAKPSAAPRTPSAARAPTNSRAVMGIAASTVSAGQEPVKHRLSIARVPLSAVRTA